MEAAGVRSAFATPGRRQDGPTARTSPPQVDERRYPQPSMSFTGHAACVCQDEMCQQLRRDHMLGHSAILLPHDPKQPNRTRRNLERLKLADEEIDGWLDHMDNGGEPPRVAYVHFRPEDRQGSRHQLQVARLSQFPRDQKESPLKGDKWDDGVEGAGWKKSQVVPVPSRPFAGTHDDGLCSSPHFRDHPQQCPGCVFCSLEELDESEDLASASGSEDGEMAADAEPESDGNAARPSTKRKDGPASTRHVPAGHFVSDFTQIELLNDLLYTLYEAQMPDITGELLEDFCDALKQQLFPSGKDSQKRRDYTASTRSLMADWMEGEVARACLDKLGRQRLRKAYLETGKMRFHGLAARLIARVATGPVDPDTKKREERNEVVWDSSPIIETEMPDGSVKAERLINRLVVMGSLSPVKFEHIMYFLAMLWLKAPHAPGMVEYRDLIVKPAVFVRLRPWLSCACSCLVSHLPFGPSHSSLLTHPLLALPRPCTRA